MQKQSLCIPHSLVEADASHLIYNRKSADHQTNDERKAEHDELHNRSALSDNLHQAPMQNGSLLSRGPGILTVKKGYMDIAPRLCLIAW